MLYYTIISYVLKKICIRRLWSVVIMAYISRRKKYSREKKKERRDLKMFGDKGG